MKKNNLILAVAIGSLLSVSAGFADDDAIIKKARELQLSKKFDEAAKLYETSVKTGASERLYVDYAALLITQKKYKECDELLTKALASFPDSLRIKNALGQAKYKNGDLSGASSLFSQVLGKDPENKYAKTMLDTIRKDKVASNSPIGDVGDDIADSSSKDDGNDYGSASSASGEFNVSNKLSLDEQKELAKKLYGEMMALDKWETDAFIDLHRQVIEKCPLTDQAQESCWRLSNLYLLGVDPADYKSCIAVLEHLLKQYPDSPLMPEAKNRLLIVYEKIDDYENVCKLYEELFEKDPEPESKTHMIRALEYGNALAACGRTTEAQTWYNKVIEIDNGGNALEARAARKKLSEL